MKNIEKKINCKNICFSKVLKQIDTRLKFKDDTQKYLKDLKNNIYQKKKKKEIIEKKNKVHEDLINNLKKAEEENIQAYNIYSRNFKNNLDYNNSHNTIINLSSAGNNFIALPKLSQLKEEFQDNEKNVDVNIIRFENVWKEQQLNENKYNKNKKSKINTFYNIDYIDIFDKKYDRYKKQCEEYNEKNLRLKRIKSNNQKVSKKLKIFRHIRSKFQDPREYFPNYSVIEKHQPEVKLNTKSKRIFPEQFINRYIHKLEDIGDIKNNEDKKYKKYNSDILEYTKNVHPCKIIYRNYKNLNESDFIFDKKKFFLSSIDIKDNRHISRDSTNINKNEKIFIKKRNKSCLSIKKKNYLKGLNNYFQKK